jgi:hypothetical protein
MTSATERTLGTTAIDYIRTRLTHDKSFAKALIGTLPLEGGSVTTWLPEEVSTDDAEKFTFGGKFPVDESKTQYHTDDTGRRISVERVPDALPWAKRMVRAHFESTISAVCIIEEPIAEASDAHWQNNPPKNLIPTFVGEEVYYVVFPSDTAEILKRGLRHAGGAWPGVLAALSYIDQDDPISDDRSIDPRQWRGLAERTVSLVVGAYDGEGYLIWSQEASSS